MAGGPPCPYLFILYAELLARQLHQYNFLGDKNIGVKVGKSGIKILFLTLVDDTMIFTKARVESCYTIKHILNKHCKMSGQLVNFHKFTFQCTKNISLTLLCDSFKQILLTDTALSLGK